MSENNSSENDRFSSCEETDSGNDIVVRSHRVMQILSDSDDNDLICVRRDSMESVQ